MSLSYFINEISSLYQTISMHIVQNINLTRRSPYYIYIYGSVCFGALTRIFLASGKNSTLNISLNACLEKLKRFDSTGLFVVQ